MNNPQPVEVQLQFTISDRLRKAREAAGLKQTELADHIGVHRTTVIAYEKGGGEHRRIVLAAWALACGVSLDYLTTGVLPRPDGPDGGPEAIPKGQKYLVLGSGQIVDASTLNSLPVAS